MTLYLLIIFSQQRKSNLLNAYWRILMNLCTYLLKGKILSYLIYFILIRLSRYEVWHIEQKEKKTIKWLLPNIYYDMESISKQIEIILYRSNKWKTFLHGRKFCLSNSDPMIWAGYFFDWRKIQLIKAYPIAHGIRRDVVRLNFIRAQRNGAGCQLLFS